MISQLGTEHLRSETCPQLRTEECLLACPQSNWPSVLTSLYLNMYVALITVWKPCFGKRKSAQLWWWISVLSIFAGTSKGVPLDITRTHPESSLVQDWMGCLHPLLHELFSLGDRVSHTHIHKNTHTCVCVCATPHITHSWGALSSNSSSLWLLRDWWVEIMMPLHVMPGSRTT